LSLREQLREGLYDTEHKPRLAYARSYFLGSSDRDPDLEGLEAFYLEWRDFDEYMVLQKQSDSLRVKGDVEKETIAVKCAKRGNDQYWWRVGKQLKPLDKLKECTLFDPHGNVKLSHVLFVTLTCDTKRITIREAWETIGSDFNNCIRNLRKKYGSISYLRCWESSKRGYPHVHILMIFHDHQFKILFSQIKKRRRVYRIQEKEEIEKPWRRLTHSFVDVQAVQKLREGIRYITKYLSKANNKSQSQTMGLALCWLFRKQSFAVSGDFHELVYAMIETKHRLIQTDLFGREVELKVVWVFIGIFPASKLGITRNEWWKTITDRQILNEILT